MNILFDLRRTDICIGFRWLLAAFKWLVCTFLMVMAAALVYIAFAQTNPNAFLVVLFALCVWLGCLTALNRTVREKVRAAVALTVCSFFLCIYNMIQILKWVLLVSIPLLILVALVVWSWRTVFGG